MARRIAEHLVGGGRGKIEVLQFHPSYTRMVPAHHVTTIQLVGCPDPNPSYERFVVPETWTMPARMSPVWPASTAAPILTRMVMVYPTKMMTARTSRDWLR